MAKTAIITGISGQDGSYLAKYLLENDYDVFGITRSRSNMSQKNLLYLNVLNDIQYIELEQLDEEKICDILRKVNPAEVYNLSSQSSVGQSFIHPQDTLNYNILSVLHWLEAIKKVNPSVRYYQASSSEMFGNVPLVDLPLKESLIFHPASPYGISKAAAHWLTVNYRESNNLYSCCGILFNHESSLRGQNFVIKKIINTAVKIKMGLYDSKLNLGNTSIRRDWGYAPQYIKAMWLMLQQEKPEDFLICSGNQMSLDEVLQMVFEHLDLDVDRHVVKDESLLRPNDLAIIYGDNTKAKRVLSWDYELSNEDLIIQLIKDEFEYIDWELTHNMD